MNDALLVTLKTLGTEPARAVQLYEQLYQGSFVAIVQRGSEGEVGSMLFLTYPSSESVTELPVFTCGEFVLGILPPDAAQVQVAGSQLWPRLLEVVDTDRYVAAVDPGQPHGIRLRREMILGMVAEYGPLET